MLFCFLLCFKCLRVSRLRKLAGRHKRGREQHHAHLDNRERKTEHCSPTRLTCRLHRHMLHVRMFRTSCGKGFHVLVSQVFRSATRAGSCSAWNMASNQMVRCLLTRLSAAVMMLSTRCSHAMGQKLAEWPVLL